MPKLPNNLWFSLFRGKFLFSNRMKSCWLTLLYPEHPTCGSSSSLCKSMSRAVGGLDKSPTFLVDRDILGASMSPSSSSSMPYSWQIWVKNLNIYVALYFIFLLCLFVLLSQCSASSISFFSSAVCFLTLPRIQILRGFSSIWMFIRLTSRVLLRVKSRTRSSKTPFARLGYL